MRKLLLFLIIVCGTCLGQASAGFTKLSNVTTLTFTDTGCPNMSSCGYQVTAVDAAGFESAPANCATGVLCFSGNIVVFLSPSSGPSTAILTWTASPTAGVTYNVYRHIGPLPPSNLS